MARILVIDDEDQVRSVLRSALEMAGHEVLEARDGKEALQLYRATPADIIITDLLMPEKDGLEVIMSLRREAPQLKIIAMSGGGRFNQMEALDWAEPLGACATLRKPFEITSVVELVNKALAA